MNIPKNSIVYTDTDKKLKNAKYKIRGCMHGYAVTLDKYYVASIYKNTIKLSCDYAWAKIYKDEQTAGKVADKLNARDNYIL